MKKIFLTNKVSFSFPFILKKRVRGQTLFVSAFAAVHKHTDYSKYLRQPREQAVVCSTHSVARRRLRRAKFFKSPAEKRKEFHKCKEKCHRLAMAFVHGQICIWEQFMSIKRLAFYISAAAILVVLIVLIGRMYVHKDPSL